jgi:hypothetical protein
MMTLLLSFYPTIISRQSSPILSLVVDERHLFHPFLLHTFTCNKESYYIPTPIYYMLILFIICNVIACNKF